MSDHNLAEALPCPFCGGKPATVERPDNIDGTQFFFAVACYCGGHSACAHKMAVRGTPEQAKADAIAAWNTRHEAEQQAGEAVAVVYSISAQSQTEDAYATVQILNSAGKGSWGLPVRAGTKLFTHPLQPLTEEQIRLERKRIDPMAEDMDEWSFGQGVRFAERALGITKDTK